MIIRTSHTVRYKNIRIILTIFDIFNLEVWEKDVSQAYIQDHDMKRDLYVKHAAEFKLGKGTRLKLLKPLNRLSESGES